MALLFFLGGTRLKVKNITISEIAYAIVSPASVNAWQLKYVKRHPELFEQKERLMPFFEKKLPGINISRGELIERDFNIEGLQEVVLTGKPDFLIEKYSGKKMVAQVKMCTRQNRYQQRLAGEVQLLLYMGLTGNSTARLLLCSREEEKVINNIYVYFDRERFNISLGLGVQICLNPVFSEDLRRAAMLRVLCREK